MSNLYSKSSTKPLKGGMIFSNYGSFNTINANNLKLDSLNIAGVFEDGILFNVIIQDSEIRNTVIGIDGPNAGYFTELQTRSNVTMLGNIPGASVSWDPDTGEFYISSDLRVGGCSLLGNIEICGNDIKSDNFNGDINLSPNGLGTVYINAPLYIKSTNGSLYSELAKGGATFVVDNDINMFSSHGSALLSTFGEQEFITKNGDITLTVESGRTTGTVSTVSFTAGNIIVNTALNHHLTNGDTILVTGNNLLSGNYTVGSIISDTSFVLTTPANMTSSANGGTFLKSLRNNIILNSQNLVKIPDSTKLTFGTTTNNLSGSSAGVTLASNNDVYIGIATSNSMIIPQTSKLQLGTSGSNFVNFDGSTFNVSSTQNVEVASTNTRFTDPILTLANYTLTNNDLKDRGIEYRYYDETTGSMKLGWFGYKNSTNRFTFIPDATNTGKIISGTPGDIEASNLTVTNLNLNAGSTIDMNCGRILNASLITGCTNTITIAGSSNITLSATNRIHLSSSTDILVPRNIPFMFGTSGAFIMESSGSLMLVSTSGNVRFSTLSGGSIILPVETSVTFDGTSAGSQRIVSNTSGDLSVAANRNISLLTTGGSVVLPIDTRIQLGNTSQTVHGNTGGLSLLTTSTGSSFKVIANSSVNISTSFGDVVVASGTGDIVMTTTTGNVRMPTERMLVFGMVGTSNSISTTNDGNLVVAGSGANTFRISGISNINLLASDFVNIPTSTKLSIGSDGLKTLFSDASNATYLVNDALNGSIILRAPSTSIFNTGGTTIIMNDVTSICTGSFIVSGITGSVASIDSENLRVADPIVTLANYNILASDGKDRGLEYFYWDNTTGSMKLGWFGRKDATGRFSFYSDAVNTNEVITGTLGDLEVSSAYIRGSLNFSGGGLLDLACGSIINASALHGCSGDLTINGMNSITQVASTIILDATTAVKVPANVPLSFGNTTTAISCNTPGIITVKAGTVVFDSNIQVNGTTVSVHSTVTDIQDPIISLGGVTGPIVNDSKDRGVEFKWNDGVSPKTGFFGYDSDIGRFVFIRDGINNSEVFSGAYSDVQFGNAFLSNIDLSNGQISGVNQLSGGAINILTTSGNIGLSPTAGSIILISSGTPLAFGSTNNTIQNDQNDNMYYVSTGDTTILSSTGSVSILTSSSMYMPANVPVYFGQADNAYMMSSDGNLILGTSSGNIGLVPETATGSINIPVDTKLNFANTSNNIYSDGIDLFVTGYNAVNFQTPTVNFSGSINVVGSLVATGSSFDFDDYILPLGTSQNLAITSITNAIGGPGNIEITTSTAHNLVVGDYVTLKNTDSEPVVDATYVILSVPSPTSFRVQRPGSLTTDGATGTATSALTTQQGKDVGIQVNYWSTTGNASVTAGTLGYKTGFFGFDQSTERWAFYVNASISNSVVTGTLGNLDVNKVFTNRMSGFLLEGPVTAGSNSISGDNFTINGGSINNTQIGINTAQTGRFTNLSNTVAASFNSVTLQSTLTYNMVDKYTLSSPSVIFRSPSSATVVSMFSVVGTNFTTSSGTMPSASIAEGTLKILVCQNMGVGCTHTVHFGAGKLITPNPLNDASVPTKLIFKRKSQSAQLLFDGTAWILLSSGAYVE